MRTHAIKQVEKYAEKHSNVVVVTADLGFSVLEEFKTKFPDRFFNVGIAEQNMANIATGLALTGNKVIMYSIGNFTTLRCLEQIRNGICYHNLDVKVISVGGGFAYGSLGMSHHATEDIGIMRTLPNMKVYVPADPIDAENAMLEMLECSTPCYMRLERNNEKELPIKDRSLDISEIAHGKDIAIFACGSILSEALDIPEIGIYRVAKLKPFNSDAFIAYAANYEKIISLEEHQTTTGLGSILADCIASSQIRPKIIKLGLNDEFTSIVGSQKYLRSRYGLDTNSIKNII